MIVDVQGSKFRVRVSGFEFQVSGFTMPVQFRMLLSGCSIIVNFTDILFYQLIYII